MGQQQSSPSPKPDNNWAEIKSKPLYINTVKMTQDEWNQLKSLESVNMEKTDISNFKYCRPYVPTCVDYPDSLICSKGITSLVFECKKIDNTNICRWQYTYYGGLDSVMQFANEKK